MKKLGTQGIALTPRQLVQVMAEVLTNDPRIRFSLLQAFDDIEAYRHLPTLAGPYRNVLAALADLAGEIEAYTLKVQWGAVDESGEPLQVPEK